MVSIAGRQVWVVACALVLSASGQTLSENSQPSASKQGMSAKEVAANIMAGKWVGHAISYSGYREGQSPELGLHPSKADILEDLRILEKHWSLIRVYGSDTYAENILEVIRIHNIGLKVMLGVWLAKEPGYEQFNSQQVRECIRLANKYSDIVFAVNVGNEVLIHWTAHPVPEDRVIGYIRQVKAHVPMPVTLADNYAWWVSDGSKVAAEVDFLTVHSYPVWERMGIDRGLAYTIENYEAVRKACPGKPIVIGEAGWPSYSEGNLHVPRTGTEENQKRYYSNVTRWAKENGITVFFFSAFDEPWKGTGTEGHWGFFSAQRKAKLVVHGLFPDLRTDAATSPSYVDSQSGADELNMEAAFDERAVARMGSGSVNFHGTGVSADRAGVSEGLLGKKSALRVPFNGRDWGGVYFFFEPHDASYATGLSLLVKASASIESLELKVEGPSGNSQTVNLFEFKSIQLPDGWRRFKVPYSMFSKIDFSRLSVIGLWNPQDSSGTYVAGDVLVSSVNFE